MSPGSPGDQLGHFSQVPCLSWASRTPLHKEPFPNIEAVQSVPGPFVPGQQSPSLPSGPRTYLRTPVGPPQEPCVGFGSGRPELRPHILSPNDLSLIVTSSRGTVSPCRAAGRVKHGNRVKYTVNAGCSGGLAPFSQQTSAASVCGPE